MRFVDYNHNAHNLYNLTVTLSYCHTLTTASKTLVLIGTRAGPTDLKEQGLKDSNGRA